MRTPLLLLLAVLAACASTGARRAADGPYTKEELVDLFVQWREGERRRDAEMAEEVLSFDRSGDRTFLRAELDYLVRFPGATIMTARELHLVGHPADMGPGEYLFLEPAGGRYTATFVTIVRGPRILYPRPDLSAKERQEHRPERCAAMALQRRVLHWRSLEDDDLAREVERTRQMLRYMSEAREYAQSEGLDMAPFAPAPERVLEELRGLDADAARARILALLRKPPDR